MNKIKIIKNIDKSIRVRIAKIVNDKFKRCIIDEIVLVEKSCKKKHLCSYNYHVTYVKNGNIDTIELDYFTLKEI